MAESKIQNPKSKIHLVGIGGAGLSAIAHVLLGRGYLVSGSDEQSNEATAALQAAGAIIYQGHQASHVAGADALIISSAVRESNPEVMAARAAGIPVYKRADFLGQLMEGNTGIAVAGSHGKTTTTGMIAQILLKAGHDPTVILGGILPDLGGNGRAGGGPHFVIEADEYDYMFLGLRPQVAVITNVEYDHPDLFPTPADYQAAFAAFVQLLAPGGRLVLCADDPGAMALLAGANLPGVEICVYTLQTLAVGRRPSAVIFQALDLRANPIGGTDFLVQRSAAKSEIMGLARLRIPGEHNVRNALAAIAVSLGLGLDFHTVSQALASFGGVQRRFQVTGEVGGVTVIDDYAHHPTEIRATLAAARQRYRGRRLWAVWQPHTFSRTKALLDDFAASFGQADRVVALDIYRSREHDSQGMHTAQVVERMGHAQACYVGGREEAADYILDRVRPGDVILTLGAGDGNLVGQAVLAQLQERVSNE
ncbi:MAG: UDP-N-acetylmuramate--L-alanine ligase [Chloroflexota bacterium]